jgi:mono/diheme cytochrome c family protein
MRLPVLHLLLGLAVAGCGTDERGELPDYRAEQGRELFADNCARCHGATGDGAVDGPQLRNPVRGYATYVIRTGRIDEMGFGQDMPSFDEDVLPDLEPIFLWLERPPHPTDGATLYTRYCANCHGADALGGRVGEDIAGEADDVGEKVREGHGGTHYADRTEYMPRWTSSELSNADVAAIESYLGGMSTGGDHDGDDDHDDDDHDDD